MATASGTAAARPPLWPRLRGVLTVLAWIAVLVGVIVGFGALGSSGSLQTPALTDPGAWGEWAGRREPLTVVFAVLRLIVIAAAWYLLGVTIVGTLARVFRWGRLVTVADLLTVPSVRHLLQGALGVGLATAALASVQGPQSEDAGQRPTLATVQLAQAREAAALEGGTEVASIRSLADGSMVASMRAVGAEASAPGDAAPSVTMWQTQPGEHFWSMAEQVLEASWERAPTDAEVTPYWQQLVETNRGRLADPGNPDLIYPGQEFEVPAPPPAP